MNGWLPTFTFYIPGSAAVLYLILLLQLIRVNMSVLIYCPVEALG